MVQRASDNKVQPKRRTIFVLLVVIVVVMCILCIPTNLGASFKLGMDGSTVIFTKKQCAGTIKRYGAEDDGGWFVCLPHDWKPNSDSCLVYSFGIKDDFSFDKAMIDIGCDVHGFDPSPYGLNSKPRYEALGAYYHEYGLGPKDRTYAPGTVPFNWPGLGYMTESNTEAWELRTLKTIMNFSFHQRLAPVPKMTILKIDVEGAEWDGMDDLVHARNWDILLLELHIPIAFYRINEHYDESGGMGFSVNKVLRYPLRDYAHPPQQPTPRYNYINLLEKLNKVADMWHWNFNEDGHSCIEVYFTRRLSMQSKDQ